jgi:prepilin-type N-terminal cleavage/methylation domain-containing protein
MRRLTTPTGLPLAPRAAQTGFTLVELLVSVLIGLLVIAGLNGVIKTALDSSSVLREQNDLTLQAEFAMQRMVQITAHSRRLLLPLSDNPNTNWPENIREETLPPSPPIGSSTLATAVLAVTLPAYVDLDFNGVPDADDDGDGRIDEDLPNDNNHDFFPGIMLIDDDGDGKVDENPLLWWDDDEGGAYNEDPIDGIDNDGDGSIDEDPPSDNNDDACPGLCGVDDDGNGTVDSGGGKDDDDEDGGTFDDAYDPVVFYLNGATLLERMPVPWDEDGISAPDGPVDGRDFVASPIAENVSRFRVERLAASGASQSVEITLEFTGPTGQTVSLNRRVRLGGAL